MFSVIIPTMWRSNKTMNLLLSLQKSNYISEIILIDNDVDAKNVDISILTKIKYLPQESNIFVNPAWNLGIKHAKNELVCICNDDINFDVDNVCSTVIKYQDRLGVFGSTIGSHRYFKEKPIVTPLDNPKIKNAYIVGYGFGMLMFLKKSKWIDIPEDLKIYYGDNWICDVHAPAYSIEYETTIDADKHTTSTSPDIRPLLSKDHNLWKSKYGKGKR